MNFKDTVNSDARYGKICLCMMAVERTMDRLDSRTCMSVKAYNEHLGLLSRLQGMAIERLTFLRDRCFREVGHG